MAEGKIFDSALNEIMQENEKRVFSQNIKKVELSIDYENLVDDLDEPLEESDEVDKNEWLNNNNSNENTPAPSNDLDDTHPTKNSDEQTGSSKADSSDPIDNITPYDDDDDDTKKAGAPLPTDDCVPYKKTECPYTQKDVFGRIIKPDPKPKQRKMKSKTQKTTETNTKSKTQNSTTKTQNSAAEAQKPSTETQNSAAETPNSAIEARKYKPDVSATPKDMFEGVVIPTTAEEALNDTSGIEKEYDYSKVNHLEINELLFHIKKNPGYRKIIANGDMKQMGYSHKQFVEEWTGLDLDGITISHLNKEQFYSAARFYKSEYLTTEDKLTEFIDDLKSMTAAGPTEMLDDIVVNCINGSKGHIKSISSWYNKDAINDKVLFQMNGYDVAYLAKRNEIVKQFAGELGDFDFKKKYLCELLHKDTKHKYFIILLTRFLSVKGTPDNSEEMENSTDPLNVPKNISIMKNLICDALKDSSKEHTVTENDIFAFPRLDGLLTLQVNNYFVNNREERISLTEKIKKSIKNRTFRGMFDSNQRFECIADSTFEVIPLCTPDMIKNSYWELNSIEKNNSFEYFKHSFLTGFHDDKTQDRVVEVIEEPSPVLAKFDLKRARDLIPYFDNFINGMHAQKDRFASNSEHSTKELHDFYVTFVSKGKPNSTAKLSSNLVELGMLELIGRRGVSTDSKKTATMYRLKFVPTLPSKK